MTTEQILDNEVLYIVVVDGNDDLGPYDAVYGYEPIIFRDEEEADAMAENLSTTGEWPAGQPTYHVEERTYADIRSQFHFAFRRGVK